ncbi:MAG TPA: hypothetical protein VIM11_27810 [Tepidisphaeraceae bacterium]
MGARPYAPPGDREQGRRFLRPNHVSAPPPWVVRLAFGNLRLRDYHPVLARAWPRIEALLPAHKLLIVHADRIESVKD